MLPELLANPAFPRALAVGAFGGVGRSHRRLQPARANDLCAVRRAACGAYAAAIPVRAAAVRTPICSSVRGLRHRYRTCVCGCWRARQAPTRAPSSRRAPAGRVTARAVLVMGPGMAHRV